MAQTTALYKILHVKEQEKVQAEMNRLRAVEQFESEATKLLEKLKNKETAERSLSSLINQHITIEKVKEQSLYVNSLSTQIVSLQSRVQDARYAMENKQDILNNAFIEMKKIEKMINIRETEQKEKERRLDAAIMDEISIRQYYNLK